METLDTRKPDGTDEMTDHEMILACYVMLSELRERLDPMLTLFENPPPFMAPFLPTPEE